MASFLITGSISWLYYSDRLMEFPLGVFGVALATVILPNLSRHFAMESMDKFAAMMDWALRLVILIAFPATIGLFLLAGPLLTTIFFGGRFGSRGCGDGEPQPDGVFLWVVGLYPGESVGARILRATRYEDASQDRDIRPGAEYGAQHRYRRALVAASGSRARMPAWRSRLRLLPL